MGIRRRRLYVVDFNPRVRTKPGKLRPALVLQSDLVNEAGYPSTIVVPATTRLVEDAGILRLRVRKGQGGLTRDSEIGVLPEEIMTEVERRVRIILGLG